MSLQANQLRGSVMMIIVRISKNKIFTIISAANLEIKSDDMRKCQEIYNLQKTVKMLVLYKNNSII